LIDCGNDYVLFDQNHGEVAPECDEGCPEVDSCESCRGLCDEDETCQAYECNFAEDKITCSFNGHLTITDDCGPLCQTQSICVKNTTLVPGINFVSPDSQNRRELSMYVLPTVPYCYSGYTINYGNAYWWDCGSSCSGGMYWTDSECNCACGTATTLGQLNEKLAPTIAGIVFKNGKINVKQAMINRLHGQCENIEDYHVIDEVPSQADADWQCGSKFFRSGGESYIPNQQVKNDMQTLFGVSEQELNIRFFPNGIPHDDGSVQHSNWCGMPSPEGTGFERPKQYWEQCVMKHAGYFNTLKCMGTNQKVHAVMGIAAINSDVCYPTHAHLNEEAYWQIGGTGEWRAWTHKNGPEYLQNNDLHLNHKLHQNAALETYKTYEENMVVLNAATDISENLGQGTITRHDHPAGTVHEMSTQPGQHMLMIYWWAVNKEYVPETKYHFAHYVSDSCSIGRIQQVQLQSGQSIPDETASSQCEVTQRVVTGLDCEVSSSSNKEWYYTKYGANGGGNNGWGSTNGRLFEFDCQTSNCRDSEGETGHWWVTCGYSWKQMKELNDWDQVIVDVKTEANNNPGSCQDGNYVRALDIDSTGYWAIDTEGDQGHWGFWFCYRKETWGTVKNSENFDIVTDMKAKTSSYASGFTKIGQWDTHYGGQAKAYGDNGNTNYWLYLFSKKEHFSSTG